MLGSELKSAIALLLILSILILGGSYGFYVQESSIWGSLQEQTDIDVLCAGSLTKIMTQLADSFKAKYPYVNVHVSAHGSLACARLVKAGERCDLIFVSDYKVIENELAGSYAPNSLRKYCDWWVIFARNEIVLALAPGNPAGLDEKNWYWKLADPSQVKRWGRANPDNDPCGYRTLIVFNICDTYYPEHKDEFPGYPESGLINTLYRAKPGNVVVSEKEFDLMVALQTGQLDAGWTYLSLAEQFGLDYIRLPKNVSLGDPSEKYNQWYSRFTITTESGKTYRGSSISYAVSIPNTAENYYWAVTFLQFVLTDGLSIIEGNGQPVVSPPMLKGEVNAAPPQIREVCSA